MHHPPGENAFRAFAFGEFIVDTVTRRLWRSGDPVQISAKTFDVLVVLLEHRDRLVSKDELLDRVWPDTAVQENNLPRQVSSLRRLLGQRADQADYILTIPGQGYRFVADVASLAELPPDVRDVSASHPQRPPELVRGQDELFDEPGSEPTSPAIDTISREAVSPGGSAQLTVGGMIGVGLGLAALVTGAMMLSRGREEPAAPLALQRLTYDDTSLPQHASWSPDGRAVVFASKGSGNTDLWTLRVGNPDPVQLTTTDVRESEPQWSPDGRTIAFRSERDGGGLFVMPAGGGSERMLTNFGFEPRWSPDSTRILFTRSLILPGLPSLHVVSLDGRPPLQLWPDILAQFRSLQAAWHPDGRRVSIWGTDKRGEVKYMHVALDSGRITMPGMTASVRRNLAGIEVGRFTWARSGRYLYFEGRVGDTRNIWRMSVDPLTEQLIEGPERLTTGTEEETDLALSPDGTKVLFTSTSTRTRLWAFPIETSTGRVTGAPEPITDGSHEEVDFDARPDGSKVAYRAVRAGRNELWERSIQEGRDRLLLSSAVSRLSRPRWSPDGDRLAFLRCATRDRIPVLALVNADGTGERALTKPEEVEMLASDWSRDGETILGSCRFGASDRYATCALPLSDVSAASASRVTVIASDPRRNLFNQRYSPDQRWITFLAHDLQYNATSTVYVIPAAGGAWRAMTDGSVFDDKPRWGPDGRILYYVSTRDGVRNVWGRRFDAVSGEPIGEPMPVTSFRSPGFTMSPKTVQMDIAVTATHLVIPMRESRSNIWMLDQLDRR